MDGVLVDFQTGIDKLDEITRIKFKDDLDEVPGIFSLMEPYPKAIGSVHKLSMKYDLYILSTAPWLNPSAWKDKIDWIHKYFGKEKDGLQYKRLVLSHNKNLNQGDFLIDDRDANGAGNFMGELIRFRSQKFPHWESGQKLINM